jgi:signal transduction histidine kinase
MARVLSVAFAPNVTVRVEGDGTSPEVLLDAAQLEQIVMNLARNARDAMPSGTLTITTATDGPACAITVADTGCGFSPDARAHAFEPFFTTKPEGKGTGLGLATVHRIVTAAGGTIQLDSRPGTGTRIKISLPRL